MSAAGVDPWRLRDQLTAGDPEEIYAMARAFNAAAAEQGDAVELTTRGLEFVADGYQVDNASPVDVAGEVAHARRDLGGGGDKLGQIARILSDIASDLAQRITAARATVSGLDGDVAALEGHSTALRRSLPAADADIAAAGHFTTAVQKVRAAGAPLATSVGEYETALVGHLRTLADLGYIPPSTLDEGPGDVDVPDPTTAAKDTLDAARNNRIDAFDASTRYLGLLVEKNAAGAPLTDAERNWLKSYYTQISPHLTDIGTWADTLNCLDPETPDARPNPTNRVTVLAGRVADGLLTLSQQVPYAELPEPIRQVVDGDLGTEEPPYSKFHGRMPVAAPPDGDDNLRRFAGLVDFLDDYASADVPPGAGFAQHLGDAAIRWKQQINVMYANYTEHVESANHINVGPGDRDAATPPTPGEWAKLFPDELSSDALGVVGRNHSYSNDWLTTDHEARRQLLGLNWQDGRGAGNILLAATLPSTAPGDTVSPEQAAAAALTVVRDAAADYDGLAHMANSQVKAAIGVMAATYVDSFSVDPTGGLSATQIDLPNGQRVAGFSLDDGTYANFLKYLAASDPQVYGHFGAQAESRGTWYVEQAIRAGHGTPDDPVFQRALSAGMRLHSALDGASAGVLRDMARAGAVGDPAQTAQDLATARAIADHEKFTTVASGVANLADLVGLTPGPAGVGANVFRIGVEALTGTFLQTPADSSYADDIQELRSSIENLVDSQAQQGTTLGRVKNDTAQLVFDAHQRAGQPLVDPETGRLIRPDPDGDMPEYLRDSLHDALPDSVRTKAADVMYQVVNVETNVPGNQQGGGVDAQWSIGGDAGVAGSLGDSTGSWSDNDDRYRIYYGREDRYDYVPPDFPSGEKWELLAPDEKGATATAEVPDGLIPTRS